MILKEAKRQDWLSCTALLEEECQRKNEGNSKGCERLGRSPAIFRAVYRDTEKER